jgi:hypothetical protein
VKEIVATPAATPVTTPVDAPTVAIVGSLVLHVVLPGPEESVVVKPEQTTAVPVIADGFAFTVACAVLIQPVGNV